MLIYFFTLINMNQIKNGTYISTETPLFTEEFPYNKVDLGQALSMVNGSNPLNEYSQQIDSSNQQVGWQDSFANWNPVVRHLFTKETLNLIRNKVAFYTQGVDPKGRTIIPSDRVISEALYSIFRIYQPNETGDIYSKYTVVNPANRNDYATIVDQTINLLIRGIETDIGMANDNWKLNIWDATVLGDFNKQGLRAHPIIYTRERRGDPFLFNMNY
jgi:hypothetical protein